MQARANKRAIIIGGGIGGVTAALALQRAGIEVDVFERADELREVGSGLPLWTNALRALHALGLTDVIDVLGESVTAGSVTTWRGDILVDLRMEELLQQLGTINMVVHRAELLVALLSSLDKRCIHLGTTCVGFTQDAHEVRVRFADGKEARADLLIGADGIHSIIRQQGFSVKRPRYAGYICWRGVASISRKGLETWAWGKGYQFGITPMTNNRAYWFAQKYMPEGTHDSPLGRKHELMALFHDWHDPIPAVIEATDDTHILRNDIYEHEHLLHWSRGRVTLLGDAAHAMTPNLGQGACQAIEDAVVLADSLSTKSNIVAALNLYEKRRRRRANTIGSMAHLIGQAVQIENGLLTISRNALIKRMPTSTLLKQLMWILDYHVQS